MAAVLKKGLSIIRGVEPKSTKSTKLKAQISKNMGRISKKDSESEALGEELLALEEKGGDSEAIKKAKLPPSSSFAVAMFNFFIGWGQETVPKRQKKNWGEKWGRAEKKNGRDGKIREKKMREAN